MPVLFSNLAINASSNPRMNKLRTEPLIIDVKSVQVGIIGFTKSCPIFRKSRSFIFH